MRARILAGVATFVVGGALTSSPAYAQIGTCPALTPPPCIITDGGRIAGTVQELKDKKEELQQAVQQVQEYANVQNVLGKLGSLPNELRTSIMPTNAQVFAPLSADMPHISISAAANDIEASLASHPATLEGKKDAEHDQRLRLRASGGDGYALANATKYKLCKMNQEARALTKRMQSLDNSAAGSDVRSNWAINQGAKRLVFDAMIAHREVSLQRLQLASIQVMPTSIPSSQARNRTEPPAPEPVVQPGFAITIGDLASAANKLASLLAAKAVIKSFTDGIQGAKDTQSEYLAMKAAAEAAEARVQSLAASDGRRTNKGSARLMDVANRYMQEHDRTTWDNPHKYEITKAAAKGAERALEKSFGGGLGRRISDKWSDVLMDRAEAYKQEAFFRPIANDAAAMEKSTIAALAQYEQSLGTKASDAAILNSAIADAQRQVDKLKQDLSAAPQAIISKRDQILASSGIAEAAAPVPAADVSRIPDWTTIYRNM